MILFGKCSKKYFKQQIKVKNGVTPPRSEKDRSGVTRRMRAVFGASVYL